MLEVKIEKILPVTDVRDSLNKIVEEVSAGDELYVLTVNGKPSAVIVGVHHLEKLTGTPTDELMNAATTPTGLNEMNADSGMAPVAPSTDLASPAPLPDSTTPVSPTPVSETTASGIPSPAPITPASSIPAPSAPSVEPSATSTIATDTTVAPTPAATVDTAAAPDTTAAPSAAPANQFVTPDTADLSAAPAAGAPADNSGISEDLFAN
jgi:prevent-host-death family protein